MKFYNLFPLSIYQSKIELNDEEKNKLIAAIISMKEQNKNTNYKGIEDSWTGDMYGFDNLHKNENFDNLFLEVKKKIIEYLDQLKIDHEQLDVYIQRSWGTISNGKERIAQHSHAQSHISFSYYLKKSDKDSNLVIYDNNKPNEFIPELFASETIIKRKILKGPSLYTAHTITLKVAEGDIIIFSSKTKHGTERNINNDERISISADIMVLAKNANKLEHLIPPLENWQKI